MTHDLRGESVIDSRDVMERIEELQSERDEIAEREFDGIEDEDSPDAFSEFEADKAAELKEWDEGDDAEELAALKEFAEEGFQATSDWRHGAALIRDDYFEDYAREFANDIGAVNGTESWPCDHIDWTAAADALQQDYSSIEFDGETYWVLSC